MERSDPSQNIISPPSSSYLIFYFSVLLFAGLLGLPMEAKSSVVYAQTLTVKDYKEGFKLQWSTVREEGSKLFIIERSTDGTSYESIGVVKASGHSVQVKEYSFNDFDLGLTTVTYRLRQSDLDGSYFLSAAVEVEKFAPVNYVISGVEKKKDIYIVYIESVIDGSLSLSLQDLNGSSLMYETFTLEKGLNEYRLRIDEELPGNYSLIAKREAEFYIQNFEILKDADREKDRVSSKNSKRGG